MFCQNCGTQNDDAAVFCCSCGARLEKDAQQSKSTAPVQPETPTQQAAPVQPVKKAPKKKMKPAVKVTIIVCAVVVCAAVALVAVGSHISSPEYAANQYMDAMKAGNWDKMYSSLNVSDSDFMNRDLFVKACKKNDKYKNIKSYTVSKEKKALELYGLAAADLVTKPDSATQKSFFAEYELKNDAPQSFVLTMERQPQKQLLFFDTWKVSAENFIIPTMEVTVPKGTTAELDSKKIDAKYEDKANSDNGIITYKLHNVLKGSHSVTCTAPFLKDDTNSVDVETPDQSVIFSSADLSIKDETLKQVGSQAEKFTQDYFNAESAHKDFSAIQDSVTTDQEALKSIQDDYKENKDTFSDGKSEGFVKIATGNFKTTEEGSLNDEAPHINVKMNYTYSYVAAIEDFTANKLVNHTASHPAEGTVGFTFVNGKWVVDSFEPGYLSLYGD